MKISLPDEDPKTIDVDVKSDKVTNNVYDFCFIVYQVLLFSYHYKCLAYWNTKIKPSLASTTWNGDTYILTVKAPINRQCLQKAFDRNTLYNLYNICGEDYQFIT